MTDKRVKVPEDAERFVVAGLTVAEDLAMALLGASRLAQWLTEHPIVPTDEQAEALFYEMNDRPTTTATDDTRDAIVEFQRRFMFTEPEPECSGVCDLLWKSNPFPNTGSQHRHDSAVREAYKRGQQSMIRKDG